MKLNHWFFTAAIALGAFVASAQDTNLALPPVAAPAPVTVAPVETNAPEAKPAAKPKPKKPHPKKKNQVMAFDPPLTAVVKDEVVNVRGQPSFVGEVISHVKKGEAVTVYETITLGSHETGEPSKWNRIAMPTNHVLWVDAQYVDAASQTVKVKKLNVRGGPGENYSIVGRLEQGAPIAEVRKEKGWIAINPPTNAYAYVAAECLTIQPAAPVAATPPPAAPVSAPPVVVQVPAEPPTPVPAPVAAQPEPTPAPAPAPPPPVAPAPTRASEKEQELAALRKAMEQPTPTVAAVTTPAVATAPSAPSAPAADVPPRVVTREGFVHKAYNIQAPADYELHDIKTGEIMDYLQPAPQQNFKIYLGTRISVVGAEVMDPRWPRTPVLKVQTVDLLP